MSSNQVPSIPASGYHNRRSNSITSLTSFNSTMSTTSARATSIPRGSSTNDLLFMDSKFNKPARKHTSGTVNSIKRAVPRTQSNPAISRMSNSPYQTSSPTSFSTADLMSFNAGNQQAARKHSLQKQSQNPYQQQLRINAQQQQPRRLNNRPNAPFTFPNGEVYIPRSKQKHSYTNLAQLNNSQPTSPIRQQSPQLTVSSCADQPVQRPQSVSPPVRQRTSLQSHPENFLMVNTSELSNSTSPSPSGTSRTNSSVNESTPPSSVDDLTLAQTPFENFEKLPLAAKSDSRSSSLSMIREDPSTDEFAKVQKPSSLKDDMNIVLEEPKLEEKLIEEANVEDKKDQKLEETKATDKDLEIKKSMSSPTLADSTPVVEPVSLQKASQFKKSAIDTSFTKQNRPVSSLYQNQSLSQSRSSLKPSSSLLSFQSSSTKRTSVQSTGSSVKLQKKDSMIKRMFSKVFSSSKKSSSSAASSTSASSKKKRSRTDNVPVSHQPFKECPAPMPTPSAPQSSTLSHLETNKAKTVSHNDEVSDQFSFFDGDEDKGLNIQGSRDSVQFNSEEVLEFMFSKLSTDNVSDELYQKKKANDVRSQELKEDVALTPPPPTNKAVEIEDDDEDQVISLDDIDLIDKIIEFGETSFPDLAAPDLGQSHRKLMRSKSIERRKSIRSISSSSREFLKSTTDELSNGNLQDHEDLIISKMKVLSNTPKEPHNIKTKVPSILKRRPTNVSSIKQQEQIAQDFHQIPVKPVSRGKKVEFTNHIFINNTYPSHVYNRHSKSLTSCHLTPHAVQQIRYELNEFKSSMEVHELSKTNTHFFL